MSVRQLHKNFLILTHCKLNSFQSSTASMRSGKLLTLNTLRYNSSFNMPQLSRPYSNQTELEKFVVDYDYVKKATSNNNILLIDVREPEEIKEHGKIPNSVNIPLGSVSSAFNTMSDKEFEQIYGREKPDEDTEIIFYCMIGKRSGKAQQNVLGLGYKNAKNYVGSWTDWTTRHQ